MYDAYIEQLLRAPHMQVLEMIARPGGASCAELQAATGWLPHTVRSHVSRLGNSGNPIVRVDGRYCFEVLIEDLAA
jgi:Protein of unknown function (DUF3489)